VKIVLVLAFSLSLNSAQAGTIFVAAANGNWNSAATWTPSGTPGAADDAYIGTNTPAGALAAATVTLTQNQAANNVYLGYNNSGGQGTLNLGNSTLTIGNSLNIGMGSGSTGAVQRGTGSFTALTVNIDAGNSLTFGAGDVVGATLTLNNGSSATTAPSGNVLNSVLLLTASTLNLGSNMFSAGGIDVRDNSTLNMNGHTLGGSVISLGAFDGTPTTLLNRGALTATYLQVGNQTFNLNAADTVTGFYTLVNATSTLNSSVPTLGAINNSIATTTAAGNVTASVTLNLTSTLNLGANMTLSGTMDVENNSTLNLNGHTLSASRINLGINGVPTTVQNRGALTATNLNVGMSFNLNAADSVTNYSLNNATSTLNSSVASLMAQNSSATTTPAGNVTGNVSLGNSTLNLGANMTLSGTMNVDGSSTLNMNGYSLTAATIGLGSTLLNRGVLAATFLQVSNQAFTLNASDTVANFSLNNATATLNSNISVGTLNLTNSSSATITATGNVTATVGLFAASTLNVGANLILSGTMEVRDNSTLNMNGHTLTANFIDLGSETNLPTTLQNRGALTANTLGVGNQTFNLNAVDNVTNYYLTNATSTLNSSVALLVVDGSSQATTTVAGNVTGTVQVHGGTLNLGANMTLSNYILVGGATLNMNGHTLTADLIALAEGSLLNRGVLTATELDVETQAFNLNAADSVGTLVAYDQGHATTTATGNVTGSVQVLATSMLTLGANMTLRGSVDVEYNSTLDMAGYSLEAATIYVGYFDTQPASIINNLGIQALNLYLGNGSGMTLHSDDVLNALLSITGNSTLTVLQANGQLTGLALNGNASGYLSILDTSVLDLAFGSQIQPNWIFRWKDPAGGNWDTTLAGLISGGRIVISAPNGYSILDQGGYTYIEGGVVAPSVLEPASAGLVGVGILGLAFIRLLKRRDVTQGMPPRKAA
jgi:filamentous hemagglutinin